MRHSLFAALTLLARVALAAPPEEPAATVDVSAIKDKLVLWSDGKHHFVAMVMTSASGSPVFWSNDGQRFVQLRILGGASDGYDDDLKRLDRNFWEPRQRGGEAGLGYLKETNRLTVECAERKTPMERLPASDARKLIDAARFHPPSWDRVAYWLARDNTGRYYYVDNAREPEGAKKFRLFSGPRGAVKLQKMLNIVSDSGGDIFSTANGELRLVISRSDALWIAKAKETKLLSLPVEENTVLIYVDLGVYTGQRFGTPCDEL